MKINRGKIIFILVLMSISISILVYSFAYTTTTHTGDDSNYLMVSEILFDLTDSVESISLEEQIPTIDKFGLENNSFSFSITNTSSNIREYVIRLIDSDVISTIKNDEIRYQLTKNGVNQEIKTLAENGIIDTGSALKDEVIEYSIIIWLKHDAETTEGTWNKVVKVEAGNVNIDTSGANEPMLLDNMIPVYYDNDNEIWKKADKLNSDINHQWYDYNNRMWANAVTVSSLNNRVYDLSGNENHGTVYGAIKTDDGITFDGTDDYINTGLVHDFGNEITLAVKVKFNDLEENQSFVANTDYAGADLIINSFSSANFYLACEIHNDGPENSGGYTRAIYSVANLNTTDIYSIVGTYDGSSVNLYIDGIKVATTSSNNNDITLSNNPYIVGADPVDYSNTGKTMVHSNAIIYQAAILDRAVSAEEVATNYKDAINPVNKDGLLLHYDFTQVKDLSGNNNHGDIYGGASIKNDSITFDGVDDYINAGLEGHDFGNDMSMSIKLKINNIGDATINPHIFGNWETGGLGFCIVSYNNIYALTFSVHVNGVYNYVYTPVSNLNVDQVYVFTGTYDGSAVKLYVDGVLIDEESVSGSITSVQIPMVIGGNPSSNSVNNFSWITAYQAAIFDRALTEEEIANDYKNEINVTNNDELLVYYDFSKDYHFDSFPGAEMPITDLSSFYTWIPRFKYDLFDSGSAKEINVTFEQGIKNTGTMKCSIENGVESCSGEKNSYTHPAFTFDGKELTGYWINKFELSSDNLVSLPNQNSLINISEGNLFESIRNMEVSGNIHGFDGGTSLNEDGSITSDINNFDIHLSRNFESSALAYLTYSQYGKYSDRTYDGNNKFVFTNNLNSKTGASFYNNENYSYNVNYYGTGASTTGNIYGVYDLNGLVSEYVMANKLDANGNFTVGSSGFSTAPLSKYYDMYSANTDSFYGDGTVEFEGFNDSSTSLTASMPFMVRNGVNSANGNNGVASDNIGGRAVITVEQDVYITEW